MVSELYPNFYNPLIQKPSRRMPRVAAIVGAGTIGPDIGYYLKSALPELIASAVQAVHDLEGKVTPIPDGLVEIEEMNVVEKPMAGKLPLSKEVVEITTKAIRDAARAPTFEEALEVGYRAFGDVACTSAAKEGISAFLEKRTPEFN